MSNECLHGMNPEWCGICSKRSGEPTAPPSQPVRERTPALCQPFAASFDSDCDECGATMMEGDMIVRIEDGWAHQGCTGDVVDSSPTFADPDHGGPGDILMGGS